MIENAWRLTASAALLVTTGACATDHELTDGDEIASERAAIGVEPRALYAPGSVIVKFHAAPARAALAATVRRVNGSIADADGDGIHDAFRHVGNGALAEIRLAKGSSVVAALAELRRDPSVAYAEPNYVVTASGKPDDPRFGEQWGLHNTGQAGGTPGADIDAVRAWDITTGSRDVVIGVVDTGVDYRHPDLADNMWVNPGEVPGNGADDDGNGVIDDVHGYNAITGGGDPLDDNGHGSHCAGVLGAVGNNSKGVSGVVPRTSIMALKFMSRNGSGTLSGAIATINYAIAQRQAGVNLRVLSNSWGGAPYSQALRDAVAAANQAGLLFVAAVGAAASDHDQRPTYPAGFDEPNVVAVVATDRRDNLASFSSYGDETVDVAARGVQILSTVNGGYRVYSGNSMATPHVAGVAALVLAVDDALSVADLKDVVLWTGDELPSLIGRTVTGRRVNAANALESVASTAD